MAKLTLTIDNADYSQIVDAICALYGYGQGFDPTGDVILPTKEEFFQQKVIDMILEKVKSSLSSQQVKDVEETVNASIDAIDITIQ